MNDSSLYFFLPELALQCSFNVLLVLFLWRINALSTFTETARQIPYYFGYHHVPGASMRNSTHGKGHEEGGFGVHKGGVKPQETPCCWASTPQNQSPTSLCYALTYTSDFMGGWPPPPLSEKELTYSSKLIKIPGRDKSVSTYKILWRFSSLPEQVRPVTCDCLQPPNRERHKML